MRAGAVMGSILARLHYRLSPLLAFWRKEHYFRWRRARRNSFTTKHLNNKMNLVWFPQSSRGVTYPVLTLFYHSFSSADWSFVGLLVIRSLWLDQSLDKVAKMSNFGREKSWYLLCVSASDKPAVSSRISEIIWPVPKGKLGHHGPHIVRPI